MNLRKEYPRPYLKREQWFSLNGEWQFAFGEETDYVKVFKDDLPRKINVPFSYQYKASGIGDDSYHKVVWYKREFELPEENLKKHALLCFNAVDYKSDIWVNGIHVKQHVGGYSPFSVDITDALKKRNVIVVKCQDALDPFVPRGKQSWKNQRFACWYVPNTGIWQSVWIDFFDGDCIEEYTLRTDIDECSFGGEIVTLNALADRCRLTLKYQGKTVKTQDVSLEGRHTFFNVKLTEYDFVDESFWWTPEQPNLFYLDIELFIGKKQADVTHTRFGMRKISVSDGKILLNNQPYYQRLILDQGYYYESGLTSPSIDAIKNDIVLSKQMGYNGARKHQKFEDPYFYYYAEELGFLTWCEMPSAYNFNAEEMRGIINEWQEIVDTAKNFTSVVCYVPLNESWGVRKLLNDTAQQNFARALYYITKSRDGSRLVSTNDGWENPTETDITSIHDYSYSGDHFKEKYRKELLNGLFIKSRKLVAFGNEYKGQPVIISEFGGIALHKDAVDDKWGYNDTAKNNEDFYVRYENLLKSVSECDFCGFCYTQLTDVQQEINGLLNEKHEPKFDLKKIMALTVTKK